jgi:hypothetical protein
MNAAALAATVGDTSKCSAIVVAAFVTAGAYRGGVGLGGELTPFVLKLTSRGLVTEPISSVSKLEK